MDLSIIVPVYNVEKYIEKCLKSISVQKVTFDYEVIVVNDGTKDDSIQIIKKYLDRYPNWKLVNKENGGLSSARNKGIEHASGKYVWFVDSDDWIEDDALQTLYDKSYGKDVDIIAFDAIFHNANGDRRTSSTIIDGKVLKGFSFMKSNPIYSVWRFWYRKTYLDDIRLRFIDGMIHEDGDFNTKALMFCPYVLYINEIGYHYVTDHPKSTMNSISLNRVCTAFQSMDLMDEFMRLHDFTVSQKRYIALDRMYANNGMFFPMSEKLCDSDKKLFFVELQRRKKQIVKYILMTFSLKQWLMLPFAMLSPKMYLQIVLTFRKK